ncbi:V-type proton ATPase subunit G2 [Striga hermonthica]|uniref:V-type proton ATPase subunit G2 n=1 Tax=Striga hermonthica TaxID=68872 RepID=A0A9N7R3N3_STRHE|nr:V-type proton ATPase subunit G2 [Striga hermonthica]
MTRLKQAKEEADKEAANFRAHMEAEYKKSISESSGSSGSTVKRLEAETDAKIESLKATSSKVSPEVVHMLCKFIISVKN